MDFMTTGEAIYLYNYNAYESFLLCMKDRRTREEDTAERWHADRAAYYARQLQKSGVTVFDIDMNSPQWKELCAYKARASSDLYEERQKTGDKP
jgi:uncharacterized protein (DUF58 family)